MAVAFVLVGATFADEPAPSIGTAPQIGTAPSIGTASQIGTAPSIGTAPQIGSAPASVDSPVAFAALHGGAPAGVPGWNSNPARRPATAVAVSGWWRSDDVEEWALSAAGEWGAGGFRGAFLYDYYALDSLFRQSYAALEAGYSWMFLAAGASFGVSAEWNPGGDSWIRYRAKAGLSGRWRSLSASVWWVGFLDERPAAPYAGVHVEPSEGFAAFAETDWNTLAVGSELRFRWVALSTSYVFPGFGFSVGVSFGAKSFGIGALHGSREAVPGWNGVWLQKNFRR